MRALRCSILMKRVYNNMDNSEDIATKGISLECLFYCLKECSNICSKIETVALVERNTQPQGIRLNDPAAVAKTLQQDLVALATEIQRADSLLKADARSKLHVIVEQIKSLKKQAEDILIEADWNVKLHHVACNFVKHPGHIYHLYERQTGQLYFSMLSPEVNYLIALFYSGIIEDR